MSHFLNQDNQSIKCGYLLKLDDRKLLWNTKRVSSKSYFVLNAGSFDCYGDRQCKTLKQRYSIVEIDKAEVHDREQKRFYVFLYSQPFIFLQSEDLYDTLEWVEKINTATSHWKESNKTASEEQDCIEKNLFPSLYAYKEISKYKSNKMLQAHGECSMIKYARYGQSIPHERIFKVDEHFLTIMWKKSRRSSSYKKTSCVRFCDVTEIRCGQQTRNFNLFPYKEVEKQSFSVMFEREQGEWNGIDSLDLICDSIFAFQQWKEMLQIIVYGKDDKQPLRNLHAVDDPIQLFLKRSWMVVAENSLTSVDVCANFFSQLTGESGEKRSVKSFIREMQLQIGVALINKDFFLFAFNLLNKNDKLYQTYKKHAIAFGDLGMTAEEFMMFLKNEQKVEVSDMEVIKHLLRHHDKNHWLFRKHLSGNDPTASRTSGDLLSFHGFVSFLRSKDNNILDEAKTQDMTQPLSDYFINSSHNTYLTGHQLKGLSSCEAYVYALQQGCRCLEIDCWDGSDEPIVTHGMTLTSKIRLRDVLEIIKVYGFDASPYPIILSIENHCNQEQQRVMASLFEEILKDQLATENICSNNVLPSPEDLKHKIILKGNLKPKKSTLVKRTVRRISRYSKYGSSSKSEDEVSSLSSIRVRSVSMGSLHVGMSSVKQFVDVVVNDDDDGGDDDDDDDVPDILQVPLEETMANLIIYCCTIPYKRTELSQNCCEMHSFSETTLSELAEKSPFDVLYLSRRKLLRVYPRGSRVDSSNYNPMLAWKVGVQMAALNIQKPDSGFHINRGFFLTSAGSGFVLKPIALTNKGSAYHPQIDKSPTGERTKSLAIQIICGQFVDQKQFLSLPVAVEFETVGIDGDNDRFITEATNRNICNPVWETDRHTFNLKMPTLCVLYVKVYAVGRFNKMVYQTCLPVDLIKPGLRYIPFQTLTGVSRKENGLFITIDINTKTAFQNHRMELSPSRHKNKKVFKSRLRLNTIQ